MRDLVSAVLINGQHNSVQGPRARALFGDDVSVVYKERGRFGSIAPTWSALRASTSSVAPWVYCIDLGFPSALLAGVRRRLDRKMRLVYEIGDPMKPLLEPQARNRFEVEFAHQVDRLLPSEADALVFRGTYLIDHFREITARKLPRVMWLPDGADTAHFRPMRDDPRIAELRRTHGLEGKFVVGIVGNIHHNPRLDLYYGWELAEALSHIARERPEAPIVGVVVGDGAGKPVLEEACRKWGVLDRVKLVGRVPHEQVPLWMNVFDLGLSTQTDDPVGWGRTTAKLPEYLACGLPLLCSDVGEAHRLLRETGQTLPYSGKRDASYPARLATKILEFSTRDLDGIRRHNRDLALAQFDYGVLRQRLRTFLEQ
ncbi:glycosyltransferase [Pendulispora brunnea]|uniref:Glycosyltransferase n=1 Tax=Pendulispora brunnea TaxID=2905690 RepID=A0ABZ2KK17_9BACT